MPVVTIRGQLGSWASEIGKQVAERLHVDYVDREVIAKVAELLGWSKQGIELKETLPESLVTRIAAVLRRVPPFDGAGLPVWEIPTGDAHYLAGLEFIIKELAGSQSMVIRGRGSQFILKNYPGALHVLVVAPLELRLKRVMENLRLDEETARKEITRFDGSVHEFIKRYFQAELEDPVHYDLVINTADIDFNESVGIIMEAIRVKARRLPDLLHVKWGAPGSHRSQFNHPTGIAVDPSGRVYVVDSGNGRIQKFTSSGAFVSQWGKEGSGDGEFKNPMGIYMDASGNVYVADFGNNRIQKFTSKGVFITQWGSDGSGEGRFNGPTDVAVEASGNVYVADQYNHRVQKFDDSGVFLAQWGTQGSGDGQFEYPCALSIGASAEIFVADINNNSIQKFTSSGQFIAKWGSQGSGNGQFNGPRGMAISRFGEVYVADYNNHRIQKFTSSGQFITKWGSEGSGDGQFRNPLGMVADSAGNLYVTDYDNHRIQVFRSQVLSIPK